jgi:hypothetical protein
VPEHAVRGRLQSIIDGIQREQRRCGRPMPRHLTTSPRLGREDGVGLRHQRPGACIAIRGTPERLRSASNPSYGRGAAKILKFESPE